MITPALLLALCVEQAARLPAAPRVEPGGTVLTRLTADGLVRIHYTLTGVDRLPNETDVDPQNGIPDVVDWTEEGAARMLTAMAAEGWMAPPADGGRGGDDRLDLYLRDIDANGYAYLESGGPAGFSTYIEIAPHRAVEFSREAFESIVGHEVHHTLEFSAAGGDVVASWIAEATATWAQYKVFHGDQQTQLADGVLWILRLQNAARALDDAGDGDLFEYAGEIWLKFLVARGGGDPRLVLDLWKAMGATGRDDTGHDAFVSEHLPGLATFDDAAAEFAVWNVFACAAGDGLHYPGGAAACPVGGTVPLSPAVAGTPVTSARFGRRASAYVEYAPDCTSGDLHLTVTAAGAQRVQVVAAAAGGASVVQQRDLAAGGSATFDVPAWNQLERVVVVGTNGAVAETTFTAAATTSGSYGPPSTLPPVTTLTVAPAVVAAPIAEGEETTLRALADYGTCSDGSDASASVTWSSSDPSIASVNGGIVIGKKTGSAMITAMAGDVRSNSVEINVIAAANEAGCSTGGAPSLLHTFFVLAILAGFRRRK